MVNIEVLYLDMINKLQERFNDFNVDILETKLYEEVLDTNLIIILGYIQHELNKLLKFMNRKARDNHYYNADESRDVLFLLDLITNLENAALKRGIQISFVKEYQSVIEMPQFLNESGGSEIPIDFEAIDIIEYEPIFKVVTDVAQKKNGQNFPQKMIGEGSYAITYKFKDTDYDEFFCVKQAKDDLNEKEKQRFEQEFNLMKNLNSPYVLKVYKFQKAPLQYTAEFADMDLYKYISKNPKLGIVARRKVAIQVLNGFKYIHSKGLLHRDISYSNILLKLYDNNIIVRISDFGLAKRVDSQLTSLNTDVKGSLNDPSLQVTGFKNYGIEHEIYALTRVLYFIMTGRQTVGKWKNKMQESFFSKGTSPILNERFSNVDEMWAEFKKVEW